MKCGSIGKKGNGGYRDWRFGHSQITPGDIRSIDFIIELRIERKLKRVYGDIICHYEGEQLLVELVLTS